MGHIAIVEDEAILRELISYAMETCHYTSRAFGSAEEFLSSYQAGDIYDLLLLDITLPGISGTDLYRTIRDAAESMIPTIFLSAHNAEMDKVSALDLGADDYITKPFGVLELGARVKAVLRRAGRSTSPDRNILRQGPILLDANTRTVKVDGIPVELTNKEFALLESLMQDIGRPLSRQEILDRAWGVNAAIETRTVDMHVKTLRRKLGDASRFIRTVRGVGYKFDSNMV
ncbi:MAG: response regulator transcription factor [Clostridia bacterium]|nr:response regulator transcription factor [Clostridia bacterium]